MRFASVMEGLGVSLVDSVMTLIAFLPILWGLSVYVKELPFFGAVPQALVIVAHHLVGVRHRRSWRSPASGCPASSSATSASRRPTARSWCSARTMPSARSRRRSPMLFANVRRNYFRIYLNYLYFNVARYGYLQAGVLVPYVALAPTIVAAGFTLGVMQQILRAFGRVESLVPVPRQLVDDDRRADLDLQAPEGLRGDARAPSRSTRSSAKRRTSRCRREASGRVQAPAVAVAVGRPAPGAGGGKEQEAAGDGEVLAELDDLAGVCRRRGGR